MVGAARFELATSRSQSERTTRLCYAPIGRGDELHFCSKGCKSFIQFFFKKMKLLAIADLFRKFLGLDILKDGIGSKNRMTAYL